MQMTNQDPSEMGGTHAKASRRTVLQAVGGAALGGALASSVTVADATGSGDELWRVATEGAVGGGPTVLDGTVYAADGDGMLYALDAGSGEEAWTFEMDGSSYNSPQVVDGTVYVGTGFNVVHAVDAGTGKEQWHFESDESFFDQSPTVADGTVYIGNDDGVFYALAADTGKERWQVDTGRTIGGAPVVVEDTVYFVNLDRQLFALNTEAGDERWRSDPGTSIVDQPTVVGETVYVRGSGTVVALESDTGETEWESEFEGGPYPPTVAGGYVFAGEQVSGETVDDEDTHHFNAISAADGEQRWRTVVDADISQTPPTVADDVVYFPDREGQVHAIDATDGAERWRTRISGLAIDSAPIVVDGVLYIGCEVNDAFEEGALVALETEGDGSSVDARVLQGALNHHDAWTGDPSPLSAPARTPTPTPTATPADDGGGDGGDSGSTGDGDDDGSAGDGDTGGDDSADGGTGVGAPGFGVGAALATLGGATYALRRRAALHRERDR